jgi:hypothetical protein
LGGLTIISGVCSPLYSDSSDIQPSVILWMAVFGGFLILCAVLLLRLPIVEHRPPFWFPAISGFLCSCFVLVITVWFTLNWAEPAAGLSSWIGYLLAFCVAGTVLSAIVCVLTGMAAVSQLRQKRDERVKDSIAESGRRED